jgi:hypothetical protein
MVDISIKNPPRGLEFVEFIIDLFDKSAALEEARRTQALGYARAGAAALERELPGSVAKLDMGIDIKSFTDCALGQVYGHYKFAPNYLREKSVGKAFIISQGLTVHHMNTAWRKVIGEYRAKA